ncbi:uncharacterized protein si:dkey-106l3.7 isoform X2 [Austrofundulus limnaeus]|uniref:Uncharacterized protein si:dkey-106l3.7 isoform X2 n=1 Tax=Austrofundulus limnaeus TaxID=52670 RepID=A0A2I4AUX5_AUSLI|nr:PREDICTED: uncharacterized protein LOC106514527 isoform X2 [Austrofundulus limnaeus]
MNSMDICSAEKPGPFLDMNLYRSFGNLMETWVNEDRLSPQTQLLQDTMDSLVPTSDMGINPRSESVDSGVELASCGTPCPASSSSASAEMDSLMLQSEGLILASMSQSPVLSSPVPSSCSSSSSPCLCPSTAEEDPTSLRLKVERALRKADSKNWRSMDEPVVRQPRASFLPKQHASELMRCSRSQSFDTRRRFDPSVLLKQMLDMKQSFISTEGQSLEVCQRLENLAREQMRSQGLLMETDALWEHEEAEAPESCQTDSTAAEEDQSSSQLVERAEQVSSQPQQQKSRHFRQRSASDTMFAALHLKKLNANHRGQLLSTNDLLERVEDEETVQEETKERSNKAFRNWRAKLPLRRTESAASDTKSQQMQFSERTSARRRLSKLFRRNKGNKEHLV